MLHAHFFDLFINMLNFLYIKYLFMYNNDTFNHIIFMTILIVPMFILKEYNCCYTLNYNYDIR